ncbi:hypothetical protein EEL30_25830 [Brevibacillus laterosporus]|uniref:ATPase AAA-type core domain-containing protein n=1 Tax=Brevibacillus laterosporus TaxID=1465 RepID=A0A518VEG8_BRELA|nr:hypothetical protein EEL30_25830 [Brevibacillus laterosporus]
MVLKYDENNYAILLGNIKQAYQNGAFKNNYIEYITFPYYKNLQSFTTINFTFPFTVLVGKNGSGKSSTLHALYGCPRGYSTGNFWFSTHLDPILETGNSPNCYFYQYQEDRDKKVVLKTRVTRKGSDTHREDPDYWEPSRPLKKYGLDPNKRDRPLQKKVIYMDFRSELSAFDQYFYFGALDKYISSKTKQDYIRIQSKKLKSAIELDKIYSLKGAKQNELVSELNENELKIISYILGKDYTSGKIIKHKFFSTWGTSVILEHHSFKYSEAHAGSGEIAIVKLIHKLLNAEENSLILLDEPEVSLHPGAQKRLKIFLMELLLKKKHQIIISTHSPNFVEGLPKEAIKLFTSGLDSTKVKVVEDCYSNEAFYTLGQTTSDKDKVNIIVEDDLARNIVTAVLSTLGDEKASLFNINFYPGGAQTIKKSLVKHYSNDEVSNAFILFDGDQTPKINILDIEQLPKINYNTDFLGDHIKKITGISNIEFDIDGNNISGVRIDQLLQAQEKYIKFYASNIYYLPCQTPEEIIWNDDVINDLLQFNKEIIYNISSANNFKEKMKIASDAIFKNMVDSVNSLSSLLLTRWIQINSKEKEQISKNLINMLEKKERLVLTALS